MGQDGDRSKLRIVRMVASLTTGLKFSSQSMPDCWFFPLATNRSLYRLRDPSMHNLHLYNHKEWTTLTPGGRGTIIEVTF